MSPMYTLAHVIIIVMWSIVLDKGKRPSSAFSGCNEQWHSVNKGLLWGSLGSRESRCVRSQAPQTTGASSCHSANRSPAHGRSDSWHWPPLLTPCNQLLLTCPCSLPGLRLLLREWANLHTSPFHPVSAFSHLRNKGRTTNGRYRATIFFFCNIKTCKKFCKSKAFSSI